MTEASSESREETLIQKYESLPFVPEEMITPDALKEQATRALEIARLKSAHQEWRSQYVTGFLSTLDPQTPIYRGTDFTTDTMRFSEDWTFSLKEALHHAANNPYQGRKRPTLVATTVGDVVDFAGRVTESLNETETRKALNRGYTVTVDKMFGEGNTPKQIKFNLGYIVGDFGLLQKKGIAKTTPDLKVKFYRVKEELE